MQPFTDDSVLPASYTNVYGILDKGRLQGQFADTSRKTVSILVDAWGVPFDIALLKDDFAVFDNVPHKEYLHARVANRTRHAEFAEHRNVFGNGIYLFGGDSLEYGRNLYMDSLGYDEKVFCQKCDDKIMLAKLDSVLSASDKKIYALTTQDSRDGSREKLHGTLNLIATLAKNHLDIRFIVQGSHRPILGDPQIREKYYSKWIPLVILN